MKYLCLMLLLSLSAAAELPTIPIPPAAEWQCAAGPDFTSWQPVRIFQNGLITFQKEPKNVDTVRFRTKVNIPAVCAGTNLFFEIGSAPGNIAVSLNGKKIGDIFTPGGEIPLKNHFTAGETNRLELELSYRDIRYFNPRNRPLGFSRPRFFTAEPTRITDVFANASFRKKNIAFETTLTAESPGAGALAFEILDAAGKPVRTFRAPVRWNTGTTEVKPEFPWSDFTPWEIGKPYLYTCRAALETAGKNIPFPPFTFGIRELWTEGKTIMMNGHPQRFRPVYSFDASGAGAKFLSEIGYNLIVYCHIREIFPDRPDAAQLDALDRLGVACTVPTSALRWINDKIHDEKSPTAQEYQRCLKRNLQRLRNHPSVCTAYVSLLANGSHMQQYPTNFGQKAETSSAARNIAKAAQSARKWFPNILYHGFGDGDTGDISSPFCYLNFTPLQEREEWLSDWAKKGTRPVIFPEFGHPYNGNFWVKKTFLPTEYFAMYYGDRAYRAETDAAIDALIPAGLANKSGHGGTFQPGQIPLWYEFHSDFVRRTNFAWRGCGDGGAGRIHFNLGFAFGNPPKVNPRSGYTRYRHVPADYAGGKPNWATPDFDIYRQGNLDFCGFIGGAPAHTAKDHAFAPDATVKKQLVFVWDGPGTRTVSAEWCVTLDGKTVASGKTQENLKTGDIVKKPFSFRIPADAKRGAGEISAVFRAPGFADRRDTFAFEVYAPEPFHIPQPAIPPVLFDPAGKTAPLLDKLGIKYRRVDRADAALRTEKHLIFGRFALDNANFPFDETDIAKGLNVLVFAQQPNELKALGFRVEDRMARQVFLRDKHNPAFAGIDDKGLAYWSGAPDYGTPQGNLTEADTPRFQHWKRTHTVAGAMLRIPEHGGFLPLMDGEFDLNYSPLLRWFDGNGSILFCTLDVEARPADDPAPMRAAAAVLREFFAPSAPHGKTISADGATAAKLLQKTGFDAVPEGNIRVLDAGSKQSWTHIREQAAKGIDWVIYDNARIAREAGFTLEKSEFRSFRKAVENTPILRGVGPSLLRYRAAVGVERFTAAPHDFALRADGLIAESRTWPGKVVFLQLPPFALEDKFGGDRSTREATFLSTERMLQLGARILTNLGARPGRATAQRIVQQTAQKSFEPLKAFFVLGPFDVQKDDGKRMLETVFSGEASAIKGDNAPEEEYPLPQGGRANWRTTASADDAGMLNFRGIGGEFSRRTHAVNYALGFFERKTGEDAVLQFNVDWRAKIWCNGELVFVTDRGMPGKPYEIKLTNLKKGRNYLAFKIGSGMFGCTMEAALTPERRPDAVRRVERPALRKHKLYEQTFAPQWDEYQHRFW